MKIDLDWIQKELDAGREVKLECVDVDMYCRTDSAFKHQREVVARSSLVITSIIGQGDFKGLMIDGCIFCLPIEDLKHFRIKRPVPTFDDLIDVAVRAVKDKVLRSMQIGENRRKGRYMNFSQNGNSANEAHYENDTSPNAVIDFINSLYTETFVIEYGPDIKRVKVGASIELANGCKIEAEMITKIDELWIVDTTYAGRNFAASYLVLKGAIVTQKRG